MPPIPPTIVAAPEEDYVPGQAGGAGYAAMTAGNLSTDAAGIQSAELEVIPTDSAGHALGSSNFAGSTAINDGVTTTTKATVAQFHNTDNQSLGTGNGLYTGGVAQILNPTGNLDRQRETGFDGIPAAGVATGTQQMAQAPINTTLNGAVTGSGTAQNVTLNAVSQTNRGVTGKIQVGTTLLVDAGTATQEYVYLTAVNSGTKVVTGVFAQNHSNGAAVQAFVFNQARDATVADGANPAGVPANATYLWNGALNSGTGGLEIERSAAGEVDGASGGGTNVAAGFEYNGQPLANGNVLSGMMFDRERNVQALGLGSGTISNNPLAANSTTLTLNSAPTTLQPGAKILLDRSGTSETNYVATSYTPGSTTVPLQIATINSHAQNSTVEWSQHVPTGPLTNAFLSDGLGVEVLAVQDGASTTQYRVLATAGKDALSTNYPLAVNAMLQNAAGSMDRQRGNADNLTAVASAAYTSTQTQTDQTNYNWRGITAVLNMTNVGTGSVTLEIDGKDPVSGQYFALLTGAAVVSNSVNVYTVYPGNTVTSNVSASTVLPRTFRIKVTANNANSCTYSVGYSLTV